MMRSRGRCSGSGRRAGLHRSKPCTLIFAFAAASCAAAAASEAFSCSSQSAADCRNRSGMTVRQKSTWAPALSLSTCSRRSSAACPWLAAAAQNRNGAWAKRVLAVNGIVLLTFPASLAIFMRRPEYYRAPLFLTAVVLVTVISLLTVVAAWLVGRSQRSTRL